MDKSLLLINLSSVNILIAFQLVLPIASIFVAS